MFLLLLYNILSLYLKDTNNFIGTELKEEKGIYLFNISLVLCDC